MFCARTGSARWSIFLWVTLLGIAPMFTNASTAKGDANQVEIVGVPGNSVTGAVLSGPDGIAIEVDGTVFTPIESLPDGAYSYAVSGTLANVNAKARSALNAQEQMNNGRSEQQKKARRPFDEGVIAEGSFRLVNGEVINPSNEPEGASE